MRDSLLPLFRTFQTGEFAISLAVKNQMFPTTNEIANCILKFARNAVKSGKSESRIVPCKNLTNLQKFFVFFSLYKLVSQVKIHLVCRKDIVDFISVIILA